MSEGATVARLRAILAAFNRHNVDEIMEFFAEGCVLEMPRGPKPYGSRYVGKEEVRNGLRSRFSALPDVHYGDDVHRVAGDRGVSEWTLTGTAADGTPVRVRGCDHWTFSDGKVIQKDSYWKIVEP